MSNLLLQECAEVIRSNLPTRSATRKHKLLQLASKIDAALETAAASGEMPVATTTPTELKAWTEIFTSLVSNGQPPARARKFANQAIGMIQEQSATLRQSD